MGTGEEPLRRRFCRGAGCGVVFWICRHCDRGHQYCGERCRRKARRRQRRAANRRHQQSREGRLDQQPHSATADFDLVRMEMENEVGRERWTLSLQFQFLHQIPTELIVFNPMGIVITYLQGDRAIVTGDQ